MSTLNKIQHFHVANGQLPQDVMHIIFEGVLPYETKLLLFTFIYDKKLFALKDLNDRIASFVYGRSEARNKPPKAFEEAHIKGPKKKLPLSGMCTHDLRYFNYTLVCSLSNVDIGNLFTTYYWALRTRR